jgi:hypothetical protein
MTLKGVRETPLDGLLKTNHRVAHQDRQGLRHMGKTAKKQTAEDIKIFRDHFNIPCQTASADIPFSN